VLCVGKILATWLTIPTNLWFSSVHYAIIMLMLLREPRRNLFLIYIDLSFTESPNYCTLCVNGEYYFEAAYICAYFSGNWFRISAIYRLKSLTSLSSYLIFLGEYQDRSLTHNKPWLHTSDSSLIHNFLRFHIQSAAERESQLSDIRTNGSFCVDASQAKHWESIFAPKVQGF
jgi:hypothetical protein